MAIPSLAMIPSGYKDGKVYSVLPENGDGDFTFSRGSHATRVNSEGLIESMDYEGSELVLNGDFSEIGAEEVLNGDFSQEGSELVPSIATISNAGGGSITQISGNSYSSTSDGTTGSSLRPKFDFNTTSGKTYKLTITPTGTITGTINFDFYDGSSYLFQNYDFTTTKEIYFTDNGAVFGGFDGVQAYDISSFTISIREVGQNWTLPSGVTFNSNGYLDCDGSVSSNINQSTSIVSGKQYNVAFEIKNYVSCSNFRIRTGSGSFNDVDVSGNGVYNVSIGADSDTTFRLYPTDLLGSIDNVSVKQVGQNWTLGTGWSIGDDKLIGLAAEQNVTQLVSTTVGKKYKLKFTILDWVSGDVYVRPSSSAGTTFYVNGNGNYIEDFTATSTSTNIVVRARPSQPFSGSIDNVSVIEIIEDTDLPRLDYSDSSCPSLLLEPQSTNLVVNSNDSFEVNSGNILYNNAISPDGTQNAYRFESTGTSGAFVRTANTAVSTTSSFSVFLKYGNNQWYQIINSSATGFYANVDIQNGVFGTSGSQTENLLIKDYGNGWYRVSGTFTNSSGNGTLRVYASSSGSSSWAGASASIGSYNYGYGFQLEEQSYATSYIPTNGAIATRLADECNSAGSASTFNSEEGVLYFEGSTLSDGSGGAISISDGSASNYIYLYFHPSGTKIVAKVVVGGAVQMDKNILSIDESLNNKFAFKYKENEFSVFINGAEVSNDTSGLTFPAGTLNTLGFDASFGIPFYGNCKDLRVYNTALTDVELQELTQ